MARTEIPTYISEETSGEPLGGDTSVPVSSPEAPASPRRLRGVIVRENPQQTQSEPTTSSTTETSVPIILSGDRLDARDVLNPSFALEVIKQALSYSQLEGQTEEQIWVRRSALTARAIIMWFVPWASIPLRFAGTLLTYFFLNPEAARQYRDALPILGGLLGDGAESLFAGIQAAIAENSGEKGRREAFADAASEHWGQAQRERSMKTFAATHEKEIKEWEEKIQQRFPHLEGTELREATIQVAQLRELEQQYPELIRGLQETFPEATYQEVLERASHELHATHMRKLAHGAFRMTESVLGVTILGILAIVFVQTLPYQMLGFAITMGFGFIARTILPHLHEGYERARQALLQELLIQKQKAESGATT